MRMRVSGQATPQIVPGVLSALRAIVIIASLTWAQPVLANGIIWNPGQPSNPVWSSLFCFLLWFVPTLGIQCLVIGLPSTYIEYPASLWLVIVVSSVASAIVFAAIYPCLCSAPPDLYLSYVLPALATGLVEGLVIGRLLHGDRLGHTRTPPLLLCITFAIVANALAVMAGTMLQEYHYMLEKWVIE